LAPRALIWAANVTQFLHDGHSTCAVLEEPEDADMNWLDNVSSDCDHPIAPACLMQGHWRHRLHPHGDPVLCRVVIDVAGPRIVAAQVIEPGESQDLGLSALEDLAQTLFALDVHRRPAAWGFASCTMLPDWARPSFSEDQMDELQRIEGYLVEASEDEFEQVLALRDQFLRGIGVTDSHLYKAARQSAQHGQTGRKSGRGRVS
jgi:hypothetical protein